MQFFHRAMRLQYQSTQDIVSEPRCSLTPEEMDRKVNIGSILSPFSRFLPTISTHKMYVPTML